MASDIQDVLNELEEIVDRGAKIPMTGKVLVDDRVIFELIDRVRNLLPEEISDAKRILNERKKILDEAHSEADKMFERGKSYIEKMAEENEIVKQAQTYAEDIARQATVYSREVKYGAIQYADDMLQQVEKSVVETLQGLRRNREELRLAAKREMRDKGSEKVEENPVE